MTNGVGHSRKDEQIQLGDAEKQPETPSQRTMEVGGEARRACFRLDDGPPEEGGKTLGEPIAVLSSKLFVSVVRSSHAEELATI
jgi:hypothetical protein